MALLKAGFESLEKYAASTLCLKWGVYILEQKQTETIPSYKWKKTKYWISTPSNSYIKMRLLNHHVWVSEWYDVWLASTKHINVFISFTRAHFN